MMLLLLCLAFVRLGEPQFLGFLIYALLLGVVTFIITLAGVDVEPHVGELADDDYI